MITKQNAIVSHTSESLTGKKHVMKVESSLVGNFHFFAVKYT